MDQNAEIQPTADDHAEPVLDAGSSPEPFAAALAVEPSKVILPQQYPAWTDGHGWNQPQQFKTIQVGDIDGDGIDELIGRGPNGIEVYKWGQTTHIWEQLSGVKNGPFADKDGWTTPERYLNIILADINGDGKAELIGLDENKLHAYSWDATKHCWIDLSVNAALPSSWAWDANSRIQAADLDGDGKAELVLSVAGVLWKIAWSDSQQWSVDETPGLSGLGADSTILFGDLDGDGKAEIVISDMYNFRAFRWTQKALLEIAPLHSPGARRWLVQLADVDGDGKAEVILRSGGRLYYDLPCVQKFTPGQDWVMMWNNTPLEGLHTPPYFSTAQFADIDGDGKAELIARAPEGLVAFRYKADGHFEQIASDTGIMTDADGWYPAQCCLTIQTARIGGRDNGFAKYAVIGRGPDGIQTWQWSADTGPAKPLPGGAIAKLGFRTTAVNGFHQPTEPGFPDFSKSPGQLLAYQLLSQYLLDEAPDAVWPPAKAKPELQCIRAQYTNTLKNSHWVNMADKLTHLDRKQVAPPISEDDFETVRKQLHTELIYVDYAYTFFGNTREVLTRLFPAEEATITNVLSAITVSPDNTVKVLLDIASVVAAIVGAMIALIGVVGVVASGGTVAPAAVPLIAAATALISLSLRVGSTYAGNGGSKALELEVRHVQDTLLNNWMSAPLANDHLLEVFLQHWGFLRQLGEKIKDSGISWSPTLTDQMVVQGRRAYELEVWRTLTPSIWWVVGYKRGWPGKYGRWVDGKYLLITTWKLGSDYVTVPDEVLDRLFGQPDSRPTGPLGVPLMDVMNSRNGWRLNYNSYTPPPKENPWLLLRSHVNPAPRRLT